MVKFWPIPGSKNRITMTCCSIVESANLWRHIFRNRKDSYSKFQLVLPLIALPWNQARVIKSSFLLFPYPVWHHAIIICIKFHLDWSILRWVLGLGTWEPLVYQGTTQKAVANRIKGDIYSMKRLEYEITRVITLTFTLVHLSINVMFRLLMFGDNGSL